MDPELAAVMLARCADFSVRLSEEACARFPLDWLWTGDDVAGQQALIMNPVTWRDLINPHLKRIADVGKASGLPVAYHCCGALAAIIPDLIDIGIDVRYGAYDVVAFASEEAVHNDRDNWYLLRRRGGHA